MSTHQNTSQLEANEILFYKKTKKLNAALEISSLVRLQLHVRIFTTKSTIHDRILP